MDAQAVSAALTPAALAPAIAKSLGLPPADVETALVLLASGAQPAFIARYRADRTGELRIDDLERVQTEAARAVGFELRRQQLGDELTERGLDVPFVRDAWRTARQSVDLEDLRTIGRRKKRAPALRARVGGLTPLCLALWQHGSTGPFSSADGVPASFLAVPDASELQRKRKRRKKKRGPKVAQAGTAGAEDTAASAPPAAETEVDASVAAPEAEPAEPAGEAAAPEPRAAASASDGAEAAVAPDVAPTQAPTEEAAAVPAPTDLAAASPKPEDEEPALEQGNEAAPEAEAEAAPEAKDAEPEPETPLPTFDGEALAAAVETDALPDNTEAIAGARTICAEFIAEHPGVRARLRRLVLKRGKLKTTVPEGKREKAGRYAKFFDRSEACSSAAPSTVLSVHRGERDHLIHVDVEIEPDMVVAEISDVLKLGAEGKAAAVLRDAALEAWEQCGLAKATVAAVRKTIKDRADRAVLGGFVEAVRPQLLAPAFGRKPVLVIDPGTQNGCRLVALGPDGGVLADDTVFPLQPKLQLPQAKARITELCTEHSVALVVVVGGTAAREVEKITRETLRETEALAATPVHAVDADSASTLANTKTLKAEMPKADAAKRRAVAAGRRVQDPLTALAKIDPRKLSLGQHQYEVDQELLRQTLDQVIGTCIAKVAVDLNAVDADTLARLPGMSQALAKAVISHREGREQGLRSRNELLEIPGVVGKAYEQASGFVRVHGGDQPLDATGVHPERYTQVTEMARSVDTTIAELLGNAELIAKIDEASFVGKPGISGEPLGKRGFSQVCQSLREPGRDPRPAFEIASYHPDLGSFADLKVGMELEGIVTHIAGFGAFVDVGIPQEALVHLSELSHDYVAGALDVVHIGQRVKGKVIEVTADKKRFALSLKALLPAPERAPRPPREDRGSRDNRGDRGPRGKGKGRGGPKGDRDRGRGGQGGGGRPKKEEKVLGFRLDLSDLAARLKD